MAQTAAALAPIVYFHPNEPCLPCSIEHLLANGVLIDSSNPKRHPDIPNPTQADLRDNCDENFFLQIANSQFGGEGLTAPMYFAVQEFSDHTEITYVMLFGYNGSQTAHVTTLGSNIWCQLDTYGRHPGDIERVTVRFTNGTSGPTVTDVIFEAHGDAKSYAAADVQFNNGHVLVCSSLNAHGTFNPKKQAAWVVAESVPGVCEFGDALDFGAGASPDPAAKVWSPGDYRHIGLDADGAPIGSQLWAMFSGRVGQEVQNAFSGARHFDGSGLGLIDWPIVKGLAQGAALAGLITPEMTSGNGPHGPGSRPYIRPA